MYRFRHTKIAKNIYQVTKINHEKTTPREIHTQTLLSTPENSSRSNERITARLKDSQAKSYGITSGR